MDSILTSFGTTISPQTAIKWGVLIFVSGGAVFFLALEQRRLYKYYQRLTAHATSQDSAALDYSMQLLRRLSRNVLLISLTFVFLTFSVIVFDLKRHHAEELQKVIASQHAAPPEETTITTSVTSDAAQATRQREAMEKELDTIKRKYEQAFVNFYILQRCGEASLNDILILNSAMMHELSAYDVSAAFQNNVRQAAIGTFKEMYGDMQCEEETISAIAAQHRLYISRVRESLNENFNP